MTASLKDESLFPRQNMCQRRFGHFWHINRLPRLTIWQKNGRFWHGITLDKTPIKPRQNLDLPSICLR